MTHLKPSLRGRSRRSFGEDGADVTISRILRKEIAASLTLLAMTIIKTPINATNSLN